MDELNNQPFDFRVFRPLLQYIESACIEEARLAGEHDGDSEAFQTIRSRIIFEISIDPSILPESLQALWVQLQEQFAALEAAVGEDVWEDDWEDNAENDTAELTTADINQLRASGVPINPLADADLERLLKGVFSVTSTELSENCSICTESIANGQSVIRLPCLHIFHHDQEGFACSLLPWFARSNTCPMCRVKIQFNDIAL